MMDKIVNLLNGKVYYIKSYDGYNMTINYLRLNKTISYL